MTLFVKPASAIDPSLGKHVALLAALWVSGSASGKLTVLFYAHCPDLFVDHHPCLLQAGIEVGFLTGKLPALETEIQPLFLVTPAYPAAFEQLALLVATPLTIFRGKIIQHLLESAVLGKNWIFQERLKSFGIDAEISQFFFQLHAVPSYVPVHMCKTGLAAQAAGSYGLLDSFVDHGFSPSSGIGRSVSECVPVSIVEWLV
jgi:hypothetical protein